MSKESQADTHPESLEFQAEIQQLLRILAHSLYTEREIFLRELISNASDALHRLQFEMLTNREVLDPESELRIQIEVDEDARTLTVSDTGIGMTRDELIENLGTIAHSGALAFLQKLEEGQRPAEVIGQFGVGFYSVFMVAEEVTVISRSFQPEAEAYAWTSRGESTYTLVPADKAGRGTEVRIRLKEAAAEFATPWRLKEIIKKHSDFIAFPITLGDEVVNQRQALWRKTPQEVAEDEYQSFYRQLTLDPSGPRLHLHMVVDVPVDIHAILFVPRKRERGAFAARRDHGLKLYNRNVLIQEDNKDLLPGYLRFVEGVVDSQDLPLNISRQTVQSDRVLSRIQKALSGRVVRALRELGETDPEEYQAFWSEFGYFIKEGVATDPLSRDDLLPLLRFHSSHPEGGLVALSDYARRMAPDQQAIYYVLGESLESVARSPHLDYFRAHNLEVLYLVDPLDGFVVQSLREYEGQPLRNVDDPELNLPHQEAQEEPSPAEWAGLFQRVRQVLGERITEVRASRVLVDSPARLVSPGDAPDRDLQRLRRLVESDYQVPAKILEVNPGHPLIVNLGALVEAAPQDSRIDTAIEQLFETLLLLEGLHPNPADMAPRLFALLESATRHGGEMGAD